MSLRTRYAFLVTSAMLWSWIGLITVCIQYNPWCLTGIRANLIFAVLVSFVVVHNRVAQRLSWTDAAVQTFKNLFYPGRHSLAHWAGAIATATSLILFAWAFVHGEILNAAILNSGALPLVTLWKRYAAPLWKHYVLRRNPNEEDGSCGKVSPREEACAYVGCVGLVLVAIAGFRADQHLGTWLGVGCAITTTICQLCTDPLTRGKRGTEGLECWALGMLLASLFCCRWFAAVGWPNLRETLLIVLLAVFHSALPDILFVCARSGAAGVPVVSSILIGRLSPVLAGLWAWRFLGRVPTSLSLFGTAFVLAAIAALALGKSDQKQA